MIIDGTTQPGYGGTPIIELDGSNAGLGSNGLRISAGGSTVMGLVINRFLPAFPATNGHGILLETGGGNTIQGNYIGTNIAGNAALPNGGDGVRISGSTNNLVGRTSLSQRSNLLSGNSTDGVRVTGVNADGNTIAGNRMGTNAAGNAAIPNSVAGVGIDSGTGNIVGSGLAGDTLVSGNGGDGIIISGSADGTIVTGCWVGLNAAGTAALANTGQGVNLSGVDGNTVGPGNIVSGNVMSGILLISGSTGNTVAANFVGLNASGTAAVGNSLNGIIVSDADGNTIGPGNVVSGNGTNGVRLRTGASGNVVKGNTIGLNAAITAAIPNADGVQINDGAQDNTIGGPGPDRNVISGNSNSGVLLVDAQTSGNVVQGNFIGSNASASAAFPNGGDGVAIQAGANANVDRWHRGRHEERHRVQRRARRLDRFGDRQLGSRQHDLLQRKSRHRSRPGRGDAERSGDPGPRREPAAELPGPLVDPARPGEHAGPGFTQQHPVLELSDRVLLDDPLRRVGQRSRPALPGSRGPR